MAKGIVLPKDYFLTRDKNGVYHWYEEDPLKSKDRQKAEVDIASVISETVGYGNIANPVMVHLLCARIDRSVEFNISLLTALRKGTENKHFEDMLGNIVEVLEFQNSDPEYPLNGIVLDSRGDMVEMRCYSGRGECRDGVEDHRLLAIKGPASFAAAEQPQEQQAK